MTYIYIALSTLATLSVGTICCEDRFYMSKNGGGGGGIVMVGVYSYSQIPPSHKEKQSGEPSWISWASALFCDSLTQKHFVDNPLKKNMNTWIAEKILLL